MNEDVFPIEHGDFQCDVSFQEGIYLNAVWVFGQTIYQIVIGVQ